MWRAGRLIPPLQNKFPAPAGWCQPSPEALYSSLLCPSPCMWCQVRLEGSSSKFWHSRLFVLKNKDIPFSSWSRLLPSLWSGIVGTPGRTLFESGTIVRFDVWKWNDDILCPTGWLWNLSVSPWYFPSDYWTAQLRNGGGDRGQNIFHVRLDAALLLTKKKISYRWLHNANQLAVIYLKVIFTASLVQAHP